MSVIDDYLADVDEPQKAELERVRKIIKQAAPEAEEVITYGMPGFKYKAKYLIAFAPFRDHLSVFPRSEAIAKLKSELNAYKLSKGTIQFTLENPLSDEVVVKLVQTRKGDIDSK